jgi:beta-galactosidase
MYKVYTEVYDGAAIVDNFVSPLGIRSIAWNTSQGFVLNGKKLWLKGGNVHQDHAGWGTGTCNTGSYRDVKMVKDAGFNFIRGSHYPHDPAFSDACDELGMILWSEAVFWGLGGFVTSEPPPLWNTSAYPLQAADRAPFDSNVIQQLTEMIRIHRNHPSIAIWSMGNEFGYSSSQTVPYIQNLLTRMVGIAHAEDSTRPTGQGIGFGSWGQLMTYTDVNGLNGGNDQCAYTVNATKVSICSEYGSCGPIRGGSGDNFDGCFDANIANNINCTPAVPQLSGGLPIHFAWRPGICIWAIFEYGINIGSGFGNMGMIDHARVPKRRYYYYRSIYAGLPEPARPNTGTAAKLLLTKDRDTITDDGRSDVYLRVQVLDAQDRWVLASPTITLTDQSGKGQFPGTSLAAPTAPSITFTGSAQQKGVVQGLAAIEYRCYDSTAGLVTITATSGALASSSVQVFVKHVNYDQTGVAAGVAAGPAAVPAAAIIKVTGGSIAIPAPLQGQKLSVLEFDLGGRLVSSRIVGGPKRAVRRDAKNAGGLTIVRLQPVY